MQALISLFTTYLPYFLLVLTLLVFVHEFGHYWVARRFGIHAEVFSIGFGPEVFGWNDRRGTRWKFSAIPLGGYVKFLGDSDETSATPSDSPLSAEERGRAFFAAPLYARAAVVLGGPAFNLIFAFILLTGVFFVAGEPYSPAIAAVQPAGPAAQAGLAPATKSFAWPTSRSVASRTFRTPSSSTGPSRCRWNFGAAARS